ncbi:phosphate ABC transporter permease subunit PstC [Clostridium botulinum]|uniref:Phosphate transport system permease protein n=1 Tax=Clostridium botulinum C/D str. DC5 TaxID=1443128 RepID=A0A0A0IK46_CLOBO|nr:phosphate ABC transporter permease subunit PstC [Clostridium botulinum]KEI01484.1 phosphate ABC transporter permease [Clostridium botulinum C/D str. BKT75002]KEI07818.1 phosphate ABC transporter permease [Clostridium botulinum C/D str. BKT2873]KGM94125.1 phosphate ABC transporter permease [Clostridium botulinum D str. CCUG 7971]KGN01283.1 phosphate ABC transporter permease [Clostridium botulinum C/D str. DC5]KOC49578.1 phosphate ABC transporter permease [Clostridium botulinum]
MSKENRLSKFKNEYLGRGFSTICGYLIVFITMIILLFITFKGLNLFIKNKYPLSSFLLGTIWNPESKSPQFGAIIFLVGSILVVLGSIIVSTPLSIALAIFINVISPKMGEKILKPAMELFVGIPSVVYGWLGITVLIPMLKGVFGGVGFGLLASIIVLSIMILPTITSISSDAIKAIPKRYIEASYGLGATRWQTIIKVIIPSAKRGILTAIVLGMARAFGEALAVQMVIGNSIKLPKGIYDTTSTLTSIITMDMANTIFGTSWNNALWSLAFLLVIISFIFIIVLKVIARRSDVR